MAARSNNFDLKLLTASKEVGLRRLRSYAAALGGGASIFHNVDELRRALEVEPGPHAGYNVVLHDGTLDVTPAQLAALGSVARVFVLERPTAAHLPKEGAPCWGVESYFRCSLAAFLDSPVVRMSMAQLFKSGQPFLLEHLLRWGHAASTWHRDERSPDNESALAEHGIGFVRSLSLVGEGRRLTEMFSHFLQARLTDLGLRKERVTFGSDGLLLTVIARCTPEPGMSLRGVVDELRVHDFPIGIVNRLEDGAVEVAAIYYPFALPEIAAERILMVFHKHAGASKAEVPRLEKAG